MLADHRWLISSTQVSSIKGGRPTITYRHSPGADVDIGAPSNEAPGQEAACAYSKIFRCGWMKAHAAAPTRNSAPMR